MFKLKFYSYVDSRLVWLTRQEFVGACVIGKPWFTSSRDLGEPYLDVPKLGERDQGELF